MNIRVTTDNDLELINSWAKARNVAPLETIPSIGVIYNNKIAGFLTTTSSNYCIIENIIADPNSSKEERRSGTEEIFHELELFAKALGFSTIVCITKYNSIKQTSKSNQFIKIEIPEQQEVFLKNIKEY